MATRLTAIFLYLGLTLFAAVPAVTQATGLRPVVSTPAYTDYELNNPNLRITAPDYLLVPYHEGSARYRVMEQEIVPATADSAYLHYARNPELYLISGRDTPVIQSGEPGYSRGVQVVPLTIHIARLQEPGSKIFQVVRYLRIRVFHEPGTAEIRARQDFEPSAEALLSTGSWYKISIPDDDIYVLDAGYLENLGISIETADPRNFQIWTTPGYELPHRNRDPRPSLTQIPILVEGESNGRFDQQDRILFFANGPNRVFRDPNTLQFGHRLHPFTTQNYVFLTIGQERGIRLDPLPASEAAVRDVTHFRDFLWKEEDLEKSESRIKSGTQWFGQRFDPVNSPSQTIFTDTIPGFVSGSEIEIRLSMAARSTSASQFNFTVNDRLMSPLTIGGIASLTDATGLSARISDPLRNTFQGFTLDNGVLRINATFSNAQPAARGWVNWIHVRVNRALQAHRNRLLFHPPEDADGSMVRYLLSGFSSQPLVLDITDPVSPQQLSVHAAGDRFAVVHRSDPLQRMIAQSSFRRPPPGKLIPPQNLRNPEGYPDYIIITAEDFLEEAQRLADYRQKNDQLHPVIATQNQIFNEFNGGVPDFTAIRDYVKHLYDRAGAAGRQRPRYLLMFGGTTYDYKNVLSNPVMRNYVFTYQSEESIHRTNSYGSDDFFGFMGDDEGLWPRSGTTDNPLNLMDIGVGRLPIQTPEEARILVDKIMDYENPRNRGEWQSLFTFIADDDVASRRNDRDLHILNADGTADVIDLDATGIRLEKIYQISYPFVNTSAGRRVPEATQAMIDRINSGTLVFNFSGHGAEQLLTDQRLFTSDDIPRLDNRDRLSIMVTATCSFGRFDDADDNSGAEKMLLHRDGGLVAALTTTRVVYTSPLPDILNFGLNIALTREMTRRDEEGRPQRLGDIFRQTKITPVGSDFNSRKFILLGDPAMRIGLPENRMEITHINDISITADTLFELQSLDRVSFSGRVILPDGSTHSGFDGEANIRIFDATRLVKYPDRDWVAAGDCYLDECGYMIQTDALFNGRVSISGGLFRNEFIIPKDVSYSLRPGRIQTFAMKRGGSAAGANSGFRIRSRNPDADALDDGTGPDIQIYLNDELFVNGGLVNDSPQLIALLSDNSGINTTGAGVGHEIVAFIENMDDVSDRRTIILNEHYQSDLDDFTSGRIEYPLSSLENGHYRLRIRAWDVFNNMGESTITFQVQDQQELLIDNVFNYPNPMHNFTHFVFEHNQPGVPMDINIRIYTLAGIPVTTIRREDYISAGNLVKIDWHGRDDDYHRLATGTYLYHVRVRVETDQGRKTRDTIERLVILR